MNKNPKRFTTPSSHESGFAHLFLIVVIVLVGLGGLLYFSWQKGLIKTLLPINLMTTCIGHKGKWLPFFTECEGTWNSDGLNKEKCEEMGGKFDNCTSPCRHDPRPGKICPLVCVRVCKF